MIFLLALLSWVAAYADAAAPSIPTTGPPMSKPTTPPATAAPVTA